MAQKLTHIDKDGEAKMVDVSEKKETERVAIASGKITMKPRTEMLDLVLVDGEAKGIVVRNLVTGEIETYAADCVVLATGGYSNVFFLSTNAMGCN